MSTPPNSFSLPSPSSQQQQPKLGGIPIGKKRKRKLAGASASGSGGGPSSSSSSSHKHKGKPKPRPDYDRDLDEADDVSDTELEAPPAASSRGWVRTGARYEDEDYDEDGEGDGDVDPDAEAEAEVDVDQDVDVEGEELAVRRGSGSGDAGRGVRVLPEKGREVRRDANHAASGVGAGAGVGAGGNGGGLKRRGRDEEPRGEELSRRNKKMRGDQLMLRSMMDDDQAKRFDAFNTVVINKQAVSRLNRELYDQRVVGSLGAMLAGMAKIFVTDVVELAKELQPHSAHPTGRLLPYHLRLAREEMERRGVLGSGTTRSGGTGTALRPIKPLFRR